MTGPQAPRVQPGVPGTALTPQQGAFQALVQEVAAGRAAVAEWNERITRCEQTLRPLHHQLHAALRDWVRALDAASLQAPFSRGERSQLSALIRETVDELAAADGLDAELAALQARHGEARVALGPLASRQEAATAPAEGKAGEPDDFDPDAWEREAQAAAAHRERHAAGRRDARRRQRAVQQGEDPSQSLRDVYRKLASALHPDREPDPQRREHKTSLMQQANQAYAQGNLLALLEMQWEAEQANAAPQSAPDARRLEHYVAVLRDQLQELQREARKLEAGFRAAVGAPSGLGLTAKKADRLVSAEAQRLRADLDAVGQQARWLRDPDETKAWLRALRQSG